MEITTEHSAIKRIVYKLSVAEIKDAIIKDAIIKGVQRLRNLEVPSKGTWTFEWFDDEDGNLCIELTQTFKEA